jgi:PKD repeat protein
MLAAGALQAQLQRQDQPPSPLHLGPEADFSWLNTAPGDTTEFINETIRAEQYQWYIFSGDPDTGTVDTIYASTDKDIRFAFPAAGTYSVSLEANNGHLSTMTKTIVIDTFTMARFSFMHCSNRMVNTALYATSFYWDLGDGTTSTEPMPTHQYLVTGKYQVRMIAYNGNRSDTSTKLIFVDFLNFPNPNFSWRQSHDTIFVHAFDSTANGTLLNWSVLGVYDPLSLYTVSTQDTFFVFTDTITVQMVLLARNGCLSTGSSQLLQVRYPTLNFNSSSLNLFPNPAQQEGQLDLYYKAEQAGPGLLMVYNGLGQEIMRVDENFAAGVNLRRIGLEGMLPGYYYVRVFSGTHHDELKLFVGPR